MINTPMEQAIESLARAVYNQGPKPEYHKSIMRKHRNEWPTIWAAIDQILYLQSPTWYTDHHET